MVSVEGPALVSRWRVVEGMLALIDFHFALVIMCDINDKI